MTFNNDDASGIYLCRTKDLTCILLKIDLKMSCATSAAYDLNSIGIYIITALQTNFIMEANPIHPNHRGDKVQDKSGFPD